MSKIITIRKQISMAIMMLETARRQTANKIDTLMRMDGGIALAEMHLDSAKELLKLEMDKLEKTWKT